MDVTDEMQLQSRALADPSRFKIFRFIAEAEEPAGVAELTELLGFNHNAIRQHLAVLLEAGLVAEFDEQRRTRGRPRKQYRLRDDALNAFGSVSGSYKKLSELLLQVAETNADPYDVGYQSALSANRPRPKVVEVDGATRRLFEQLQVEGFEPEPRPRGALELTHCPFAEVASDNPAIVCGLHQGLIQGFIESQNPDLKADLLPKKPRNPTSCRVTVAQAEGT